MTVLLSAPLSLESSDVQVLLPGWLLWDHDGLLQKLTSLCLLPEMILNALAGSEARTAHTLAGLGALGIHGRGKLRALVSREA